MVTALLSIDIQNDYFEGGRFALPGASAAAERAAQVLDRFRRAHLPVVHVQHVWDADDALFFAPGTPGVEIHDLVAPVDGEPLVVKEHPNAFRDTDLRDLAQELEVDAWVVVGMQTNLCVDSSVRAAADLGWEVTVVGDACAACDLDHGGRAVCAADVHAAFLAALDGSFATVVAAAGLELRDRPVLDGYERRGTGRS